MKLGEGNKANSYILPMIGGRMKAYNSKQFPRCNFRNCFAGDLIRPEIKDKILVLYRFSGDKKYVDFENKFIQTNNYYHSMYEPDKFHTMYVFDIPDIFKDDYKLLLEGKYSKTSKVYKTNVSLFHGIGMNSQIMGVLHKTEDRYRWVEKNILGESFGFIDRKDRDIELSSKLCSERDYYNESLVVSDNLKLEESSSSKL